MKQEEKDLLLKDLCARLPYGVKVQTTYINPKSGERKDIGINVLTTVEISMLLDGAYELKSYLFPLSSMTEKQKTFFDDKHIDIDDILGIVAIFAHVNCEEWIEIIDWLNKNHFDYRGLISMELAIDATGLNIY